MTQHKVGKTLKCASIDVANSILRHGADTLRRSYPYCTVRKTNLPKGASKVKRLPPLRSLQERERAFTLSNLTRKETGAPNLDKEREHNVKGKRKRTGVLNLSKRSVRERERAFSVSLVSKKEKQRERERAFSVSKSKRKLAGQLRAQLTQLSSAQPTKTQGRANAACKVFTVRNPKPSFGFFLQAGAHKELRNAKKLQLHSKHSTKHASRLSQREPYLRVGFQAKKDL